FGNAVLSLMTKLSSGYWDLFDPTNGYTAIHADVARHLPFEKISHRYFFETDMLFRLNTLREVGVDIPMEAHYGDEQSNLKISVILAEFLLRRARNSAQPIFYTDCLRAMSLPFRGWPPALVLVVSGVLYGGSHWRDSLEEGIPARAGAVVLSALPILLGMQV